METDFLHSFFTNLSFQAITLSAAVSLSASLVLLILSAMISASEIAFFTLSQQTIKELIESNNKKSKLVIQLLQSPKSLNGTILLSNTFVNVTFILLSIHFVFSIINPSTNSPILYILVAIVLSFILLVFGELIPRHLASQAPKRAALFTSPYLHLLEKICRPFITFLASGTFQSATRLRDSSRSGISMEDITQALEFTVHSDEDTEILEGIIKFGNIQVKEIMTSRVDMVYVDYKMNYKEVLAVIIESEYSRIPIFSGSKDNIIGVLYSKDLLPHLDKPTFFKWQSLARPPYFVPETKKIDDLLNEFQKQKIHMALVVDEYGGTSGLITLEDILEEIVGDISDEYDDEQKLHVKLDQKTFVFEAKIKLNDFFKLEEIEEDDFEEVTKEVETLAGLILELKGEIPVKNESIEFGKYVFKILSVDNRRIKKVKLFIN